MTKRISLAAAVALFAAMPVAALAAGIIESSIMEAKAAAVGLVASAIVGTVFGWALAFVGTRAAAARAKAPEDRNLADKLAIEADRRAQALDMDHLQRVIDNYLMQKLDVVLANPTVPPMSKADDLVAEFYEVLTRRNPDLAGRILPTKQTVQELIAAGIGRITHKDALAAALDKIGVPGVVSVR